MPNKPPARVAYIGDMTGDNMQVTPEQLLEMAHDAITRRPVKGLIITFVRETPDGGLDIDNFRCQLPRFVEMVVVARNFIHHHLA